MTYPRPALAVDLALMTVRDGALRVLLVRRPDADTVGGDWALPGAYVRIDETLADTAQRILRDKVGLPGAYAEQLASYSALDRDPRERVISMTHLALLPAQQLAGLSDADHRLAQVHVDWPGETGGPAQAMAGGTPLPLAFDHAAILGDVVKRLRGKLDYTAIGLELLPAQFTLRQAQDIYQAILGRALTKPAFRRKLLDRDIIQPTGQREAASAFRPAELYTRK